MELTGEILAAANALLFALSSIFNKRALDQMDKDSGMVITLVVNNVINGLGLLAIFLTGRWVPLEAGAIPWFVLAGAFTSFLGRYLIFESVNINGPSRAGAYKVASPVFTLFIGMFILSERINLGSMAGAVISLTGLWIISLRDLTLSNKDRAEPETSWRTRYMGTLVGLGSGLCFAVGMAARKAGIIIWPSALAGAFTGSLTALVLTIVSLYFTKKDIPWRRLAGKESANYIYSGICTSLAVICFFMALQYITVTIANVIASLEPLFTIILAYWILRKKERITTGLAFGSVLVSIGAALIFIY
ncbi:MAG: DMT family transporter [Bacillota bacterium]